MLRDCGEVEDEGPVRPTGRPGDARGRAALVIDDDELVATVIRVTLERAGYRVLTASEGRAGLELLEAEIGALAVVVLDLKLPGMSGSAVMAEIAARAPELPVVAVSGFAAGDPDSGLEDRRFAARLTKPFRPDDLLQLLGRLGIPGGAGGPAD